MTAPPQPGNQAARRTAARRRPRTRALPQRSRRTRTLAPGGPAAPSQAARAPRTAPGRKPGRPASCPAPRPGTQRGRHPRAPRSPGCQCPRRSRHPGNTGGTGAAPGHRSACDARRPRSQYARPHRPDIPRRRSQARGPRRASTGTDPGRSGTRSRRVTIASPSTAPPKPGAVETPSPLPGRPYELHPGCAVTVWRRNNSTVQHCNIVTPCPRHDVSMRQCSRCALATMPRCGTVTMLYRNIVT